MIFESYFLVILAIIVFLTWVGWRIGKAVNNKQDMILFAGLGLFVGVLIGFIIIQAVEIFKWICLGIK